jgi:hypothetical protein
MEKMKLALADLVVESFSPTEGGSGGGTVRAQESAITDEFDSCGVYTECNPNGCDSTTCTPPGDTSTCAGWYTCAGVYTCGGVETCQFPACTGDPQNIC